jgi:signal transduction histidine kinase
MSVVANRAHWIVFLLAAFSLAAAFALFLNNGNQLRRANDGVALTQSVLRSLDRLLIGMLEAETGQRGFVITGDPRYLGAYAAAKQEVGAAREQLGRLLARDLDQAADLREIDRLIAMRHGEMQAIIDRRGEALSGSVGLDAGEQAMERLRQVLAQVSAREERLLIDGRRAGDTLFRNTALLVGAAGLVSLGVLFFLFATLKRGEAGQARLNEMLRSGQADLERLVELRSAELAEANRQLSTSNEAKSAFLAHMSHELRTPLNAILGFSDMMLHQILGPLGDRRYFEYAGHIRRSGEHLLDLVNDVLDLSKIEAGRLELEETAAEIDLLIEECIQMLGSRAAERGIEIGHRSGCAGVLIRCDPRRLKQVLLNLLSNAVKYTRLGGRIEVVVSEGVVGGMEELTIEVVDQGIGMTAEDIALALEPFGQVRNATNRDEQGTGLGLPLSRRLVELHDGRLELSSEPGEGTRAFVRLPGSRRIRVAA